MSYKMRINFRLGEDLEKRIKDGRNEYSITVYVDRNNKKKYYVDIFELMDKYKEEENIHDYR